MLTNKCVTSIVRLRGHFVDCGDVVLILTKTFVNEKSVFLNYNENENSVAPCDTAK